MDGGPPLSKRSSARSHFSDAEPTYPALPDTLTLAVITPDGVDREVEIMKALSDAGFRAVRTVCLFRAPLPA